MERLAIFVEGQTERIFVERLIQSMAGLRNYHIDAVHAFGGGALIPRVWEEIHATRPSPLTEYYILIYESMNDSRVLSDIRDQFDSLAGQNYRRIIGIRDVYPESFSDIPTIRSDFAAFAPAAEPPSTLILAVMEFEAWYIAEHTHFHRMHASLTATAVSATLGYDPSLHDVTTVACPANDLRKVYSSASLGYKKSRRHCERTVNELSFEEVYLSLRTRIGDLHDLVTVLEEFFG